MARMPILQTGICRRPSDGGFTLVELLVVLAVIAALAVAGSMSIASVSAGWGLRSAAYDLRALIADAQYEATRSGKTIELSWKEGAWTIKTPSQDRQKHADDRLTVSFIPAFSDGGKVLQLLPDGSSTGGTFRLTRQGRSIDVATHWLTGVPTIAWPQNPRR